MPNTDAAKQNAGFQYRLRFFHKCRSPGVCDPAQLDRYQVEGSVIESTCGAPMIAVLVRHRHDPERGLSRECQRAQFAPGKATFAVKAIVVPADRVVDYMDQTLLQQPVLVDSQGRNLLGGPDVGRDGSIYATPLEQNGIAHLNNFCLMTPWNENTKPTALSSSLVQTQRQDACTAGCVSGGNAAVEGPFGGISSMLNDSAGGSGGSSELCLLVQLLKRNTEQHGKWFAYDIPHLVSRPFQVMSRADFLALQAPSAMAHPSSPHQQRTLEHMQVPAQGLAVARQQRVQAMSYLASGPIGGGTAGSPGGRDPMASPQQPDMGPGYTNGSAEAGTGFGLEPAMGGLAVGGNGFGWSSGGGAGEGRPSSHSGGSPHAAGSQRGSRSRRRSCLSRDSSYDDGSVGGAPAAGAMGPMRTHSSLSAAEVVTSGAPRVTAMLAASAAADAAAAFSSPLSPPSRLASTTTMATAEAFAEAAGSRTSNGAPEDGAPLGLQQTSSATLLDLNIADFLDELQAQPLLADDGMDLEGPPKRVKSISAASDVATLLSGNTSGSTAMISQPHMPVTGQQHMHQLEEFLARNGNGAMSGGPPVIVDHQSRAGSWSAGMSTAQLLELRKQSTGVPGTTAESFAVGTLTARSASAVACEGGSVGGSGVRSTSQLDALVQLLGQPGAMQDALDRMEQEHLGQVYSGRQAESSGGDSMQV